MEVNRGLSCLVIGAGIAGLIAARALRAAGHRVLVLDKGRGVGGRMATRRIEGGVFDHGAQFVTVRDPRFQQIVEGWQAKGVVKLVCFSSWEVRVYSHETSLYTS